MKSLFPDLNGLTSWICSFSLDNKSIETVKLIVFFDFVLKVNIKGTKNVKNAIISEVSSSFFYVVKQGHSYIYIYKKIYICCL